MKYKYDILQEFHNYLIAQGRVDRHTEVVKVFLDYATENNLDYTKFKLKDVNDYVCYRLNVKKDKNTTLNNKISTLRKFYEFMYNYGYCTKEVNDEVHKTKTFKVEEKIKDSLTLDELRDAIAMACMYDVTHMFPPEKIQAVLYLFFTTGLRKSELLNLKRIDIDTKNNQLIVRKTKTKKERICYFVPEVSDMILRYYVVEPEEKKNAFNISTEGLRGLFRRMRDFVPERFKNFKPKDMRDSFAQYMIDCGVQLRDLQLLMGHSCVKSTLKYYTLNPRRTEKIYREKVQFKFNNRKRSKRK